MNRRSFLVLGGGVIAGGAGVAGYTGQLPAEAQGTFDTMLNETVQREEFDPYTQTFSSPLVSKIEFKESGEMAITLGESHEANCLGIWHEVDDTETRDPILQRGCGVMASDLPPYNATVSIDIVGALADAGVTFPSRRFKIVGFSGQVIRGRTAEVVFVVPAELMPEGSWSE